MLSRKLLAILFGTGSLVGFSYANTVYYDRAPFLDQKEIDISDENKDWFYPNFYVVQTSDGSLIIKDYNGIEALNVPGIKLDGSIPFFIGSNNFLIGQTSVSNPDEYIELNDGTDNTYDNYLYITNWTYYDVNNIKKVKIGTDKDIDYIAFLSDKTLEVLYTDGTAEYFSIDYSNGTVRRSTISPDDILNNKLILLKNNGVISVFYSLTDKTLYIRKDGSLVKANNLPEFNLSDLNNVTILNYYVSDLGKSVDRISAIINGKKYLSAIDDISNFSEADNDITYNIGDVINYDKETSSINYNAYDPLNGLKKEFDFYIPLNKRIENCGNFDFITEANQLLVKFDKCLFLYNNMEHTDSIVDNTMIPFYVDYDKKLPELFALSKRKWTIEVSSTGERTEDETNKVITLPYYTVTGYSYYQSNPNNVNITYISPNGIQFDRLDDDNNDYTTIWFKDSYLSSVNNLEVSYDVKFTNGAEWGGITVGNIYLDINPSRIGFRGPEVYTDGLAQDTLYHIKIDFKRIEPNKYDVKIYVNGKLVNEYVYDETDYDIENSIKKYGIGIRSPYNAGTTVQYTNVKFGYMNIAKDKEVFELLNLSDYYKFRTQLNTVDEANQYITDLLTAYKRAYLLANDIGTQDKKTDVLGIEDDIRNILTGFNTDYKAVIDAINQKIAETEQQIDQTKLDIFQNLPLTFENIVYSFSEKPTLDFTQTIDNMEFIDKSENTDELSKFDETTQGLIQKKEEYKLNLTNRTYQRERIINTNSYILDIANLSKFIEDLDNSFDGELYIDGNVYDVSALKTQLADMFNTLYSSTFDDNGNAIGSLMFFNSDYDINRYVIPDILTNYNNDQKYLDLQGIGNNLSDDNSKNYMFDLQKIYNAIKNLTREDIINEIGQYSNMYINSYVYDDQTVSDVSMKDFITNFNDPDKSALYKDDDGDGQNDYVLEDVLLDIFTKLTDDTDDSTQDIDITYEPDDLTMFYILKFKRDLADGGITYSDYFSNLTDVQNYDPITLDQSVKDYWANTKYVINYLYDKVPEQTWTNDINKWNFLLNNIDYFIKGVEVPYVDNASGTLLKLTDPTTLEGMNIDALQQLEFKSDDYYTLDNAKWDSFYDPVYFQYYKDNGLTKDADLIETYYNLLNELATEQQQLQDAYQTYADSLNARLNLLSPVLDVSNYSFDGNETSVSDSTITSIVDSLQKDYVVKINNEIQAAIDGLKTSEQNNINAFGGLLYLLDPIRYQPTALTYEDSDKLSNEYSDYLVQQGIIDKITVDNISQYETYDISKPQLFNEYYDVLKEILTLKQKLFKGDASYDDVVDAINKISDYKESKSEDDLNAYITYVKDIVKKYYYDSIIDLYNVVKTLKYDGQDFKFVLSDYLNNSTELANKINDENFNVDWSQTIWNSANIVYDPANNVYDNSIYDNLMNLIDTKVSEVDPYINYNIAELQLEDLGNQVKDFESKYDDDLNFDDLNTAYTSLKGQINAVDLSNITVDTTDLQNEKDQLLSDLDNDYQTKINEIKNNISDYLKKYFDSKVYLIYTAKNVDELNDIYNGIMQELSKITGENETDDPDYQVQQDTCPINDSENWLGLKTESGICGSIISNGTLDTTYIDELKQKLLDAKNQKMQYLSNNTYAEYFTQLLSYDPNALDEIFDWTTNSLKTDNPKLEIVPVTTNAGDFRTENCQYIIYDRMVFLGLICDGHLPKVDTPDDADTDFNKIALYFTDTVGRNYYYNLILHYDTIQEETNSHYKSVFLILDDTKDNKVLYLKSYFIPNQTSTISIRNDLTTYMAKTFDEPFLTKTGIEEITSSVINDIDILARNGININDITDDSLLFNDKKLTAYLVNNVSYIIDKIKLIEDLVDEATVDSLYNLLSDKLVNVIGLEDLDSKDKILSANTEKEIIFNTLNQINNLTFNTYESQVPLIQDQLDKIEYFTDAKDYLANLMQSKVNAFDELKDSLLFQEKLNTVDEMLGEFNEHIADTTLDGINELYDKVKDYINNNFGDEDVISSLMDKLDTKYNETKTAIENNIAYSSSYIDADSEIEGKTEANNILTNTFDNKFVEQLSFNNILKDTGLVKIIDNQYVIDNTQLDTIKSEVENKLSDNSDINVDDILNTTSLMDATTDTGILQDKTIDSVKQKLVPFIYITLRNGKYNIPVDVTNVSTDDTGFFEGVDPSTDVTSVKNVEYKTIKGQVLDADGNVIGNKDIEGDVTVFMPSEDISLQLKPDTKFLVEIKNLSDQQNTVEFYQKDSDGNLTPIIMNDFVVQGDVAKIKKNYSNSIQGIKTGTLNVTR